MNQSEEDDIDDQCYVYWDCENEHLWACQPGPIQNTWLLEQLHQTNRQDSIEKSEEERRFVHMAAVSPAVCPDCGCRMFPIEVMVNGHLNEMLRR